MATWRRASPAPLAALIAGLAAPVVAAPPATGPAASALVSTAVSHGVISTAAPAATADTFEVKVQQNTAFRVAADRITHTQMGLILLEADGTVVAAIQQHQIVYVVNRSAPASQRFEIQTYDNSTYTIPGDTLVPEANGLIRVDGPNGTIGYISNSQLRYVVAVDAKR